MVSIAILRTGPDVAEPVPVSMACELSSYGFFQRQVRQALPQTNARKLKPWFSGCWHFFVVPAARNAACMVRRRECVGLKLIEDDDVCVVDACSGAVRGRPGPAGGRLASCGTRTCMCCREFLAFRSCYSLPSGLIGTFGQEAWPVPLSLDGGFSRHSICRGVPSMRCRFGR